MGANTSILKPTNEPFEVSLPNGTVVDINTKEGANAFLRGGSSDCISSNIKEIAKLRKKETLNAHDKAQLEKLYTFVDCLAEKGDPEIFRAKIQESGIQDWLSYITDEFERFSKKRIWILAGRLEPDDCSVLLFCVAMFERHVVPTSLVFGSKFFHVLANFLKARHEDGDENDRLYMCICGAVGKIIEGALDTALYHDNSWSTEKIFKKWEASGMLEQILLCATVPAEVPLGSAVFLMSQDGFGCVLMKLKSCSDFVIQTFKSGQPCGDTLKAILAGRAGSKRIRPDMRNIFQGIATLAGTMDAKASKARSASRETCQHCGESETPLSVCGGCSSANYCSKECQKADWKSHKPYCRKGTKVDRDRKI